MSEERLILEARRRRLEKPCEFRSGNHVSAMGSLGPRSATSLRICTKSVEQRCLAENAITNLNRTAIAFPGARLQISGVTEKGKGTSRQVGKLWRSLAASGHV